MTLSEPQSEDGESLCQPSGCGFDNLPDSYNMDTATVQDFSDHAVLVGGRTAFQAIFQPKFLVFPIESL